LFEFWTLGFFDLLFVGLEAMYDVRLRLIGKLIFMLIVSLGVAAQQATID